MSLAAGGDDRLHGIEAARAAERETAIVDGSPPSASTGGTNGRFRNTGLKR